MKNNKEDTQNLNDVQNVELQNDLGLNIAIQEGLDDVKSGRVTSHEVVMNEIKERYNY